MERIAEFSKVSFEQFRKDVLANTALDEADIRRAYDNIKLPTRATSGSAGYDFYLPFYQEFNDQWRVIPTGIRCRIDPGWMLSLYPKSGLGFKCGMRLANTVGIVDSDYYGAENEGHIMAKIATEIPYPLNSGVKFMQGVFIPYGITTDDECDGTRVGGFGSTGDK